MAPLIFLRKFTIFLRAIPGGVMIGDVFRRAYGKRRRQISIDDFDGDLKMAIDLGEHMQSQIFWHGSYSREIVFLLRRIIEPGMVFVDGGANVGEITLLAGKLVGPAGRVFSFEPLARFADQLERNVQANEFAHVEIQRCGLSSETGEAVIYTADLPFADGTQHDGLGTLFSSGKRSHAEQSIPLVTLDDFLIDKSSRVDIIKLDIEGAELSALRGAQQTLAAHAPELIIEVAQETCQQAGYEGSSILEFLEQFDYKFYNIGRHGYLAQISAEDLGDFQNIYCSTKNAPASFRSEGG